MEQFNQWTIKDQYPNLELEDIGAGYTVKSYKSEKEVNQNSWSHKSITLNPLSFDPNFENIKLDEDAASELKVVGIFVCVLN